MGTLYYVLHVFNSGRTLESTATVLIGAEKVQDRIRGGPVVPVRCQGFQKVCLLCFFFSVIPPPNSSMGCHSPPSPPAIVNSSLRRARKGAKKSRKRFGRWLGPRKKRYSRCLYILYLQSLFFLQFRANFREHGNSSYRPANGPGPNLGGRAVPVSDGGFKTARHNYV